MKAIFHAESLLMLMDWSWCGFTQNRRAVVLDFWSMGLGN